MSETLNRASFLRGNAALVVAFALPVKAFAQQTYSDVDQWLAIDGEGRVVVSFGKVELGTGTETALLQLVADELYVPIAHVRVVPVDTMHVPDQGYTAGSATLSAGAVPVRHAAATARARLLARAAERLKVPAERLETRDGAVIVPGDASRSISYGELASAGALGETIDEQVALREPATYDIIGKPVARVDLPGKVTGEFTYVQNVRLPGMLHARVILPPAVGATLRSYDAASLGALRSRVHVVRKGDFLAVAAAKEWDAIRAARKLKADWSAGTPLPAPNDLEHAVQQIPGTARDVVSNGDVDGVFAGNAKVLSARYEWPYQSHGSIGPSCGLADVRGNSATVWSATQGVYPLRGAIAELLGFSQDRVLVIYAEGAGCYGHNGADDVTAAAAIVSRELGKPVRVQYMRADETGWDPKGPAMVHEMRGSVDAHGKIAAWEAQIWSPTHSGRPDGKAGNTLPGLLAGWAAPRNPIVGSDRNARTNYDLPVQRVTMFDQERAIIRQSALRGLGGTQNTFANESFIDELAHAANQDPLAFRRAHTTDPRELAVLDAMRKYYAPGRGAAFVHYENTQAIVAAVADVSIDRGTIRVNHVWIAHDCGLIVNPNGLRNQIEGNVLQAVSRALYEEVRFNEARDWESYPILRFDAVPNVTIELLDRPDVKIAGSGEATTTVIAPAIANAVFAKTGKRLRRIPFVRHFSA